ncbi:hypothetical protein CDAR_114811 [Caerostris darwini]|uniref:Uncharacterized protein n=1 Tax=Caerostris darwini TaxID=1538125 RepID=A0AAV4MF92_9ARAC|nr:hypothetical protein CDAR_114811 [Caerostris darwini]
MSSSIENLLNLDFVQGGAAVCGRGRDGDWTTPSKGIIRMCVGSSLSGEVVKGLGVSQHCTGKTAAMVANGLGRDGREREDGDASAIW